jgi:hypothetical protein
MQWSAIVALLIAVSITLTGAESMGEDHTAMEAAAPKMMAGELPSLADVAAFIQEDVNVRDSCSEEVSKTTAKFQADLRNIQNAKEASDARANKAEVEAQKQAGISRRCLAAENMLSADEKDKSAKMRAAIEKEAASETSQFHARQQELEKQCQQKIELARKEGASSAGSQVNAALQASEMRDKGELEQLAAKKSEFKLQAKKMQLKLKVELDNVQKKEQASEQKVLQMNVELEKAKREVKDLTAKMERQAVLAKQTLETVKAQLAAKTKECDSAKDAVMAAREQARKSAEGTTHAQLEAKAAETADKVQVAKLKTELDKEKEKEKAVEKALNKKSTKLGEEDVELNSALQKSQRLEADNAAEKNRLESEKARLKDSEKDAKSAKDREHAKAKKLEDEKSRMSEELAGAKAKAVAQEAKDAITEGQAKGQLTVVLGKLKANQATITELRKEIVQLKKQKSGGEGLQLKAKLVEEQVANSQMTASRDLTRCRAKSSLLELKAKELAKEKDGLKARLVAKGKTCDKQHAESKTEIKVCMARSVGYQNQIAACIGAEKALKREELSVTALGKLSKEKLASRLRMRRKELAICKAKASGLEKHLQDKMVLQTKIESTERVLAEWKKTGKALQTQVHRLTMQRNQELLKQQRLNMKLASSHKQLAEAGIKVNGLNNEEKDLLSKKEELLKQEKADENHEKVVIAKEDQHLQVCRLKVRKLIGSLRVCALKKGALKVAYQSGKNKSARQLSRIDVRLRKCEAKGKLKIDLCRKKQHAAEALAGSAKARLQACTSFRAKTTTLMGHMAKAEATFQKCRKMLKVDEAKLSKTMQINSGLTTALADKQRKEKLATAKADSLEKGLKICENVAKKIEHKYKSELEKRNTEYNSLLKTWNTYKSKNKGLKICEKIAAQQRVAASVCNAKRVGIQKELTACLGAEQMLKQEGASLAQLKAMSHDKLEKQITAHRKSLAVCQVKLASMNAHLVECASCKDKIKQIKEKFQGVAGYLKANAKKWEKKDELARLQQKKEGAQARAMARGLSRAERQIARRDEEIKNLQLKNKELEESVQHKGKLMREYKDAMRGKLRKIKKALWTKAQGTNKQWLRDSLKKCHATEVELHNKWVASTHKAKMNLELCRRAGKVALKVEENKCSRVKTRAALAERSSNVALTMCKRSAKRLETRAALAARASKVAIDMCSKKKDEFKAAAEACQKPTK